MDSFGQLDMNDLRPQILPADEADRRERIAAQAEVQAWRLIAEAAELAVTIPGLSSVARADLERVADVALETACLPPRSRQRLSATAASQ